MVAWEGWEECYNSWEPVENLEQSLIDDYEERVNEAEAVQAAEDAAIAREEQEDVTVDVAAAGVEVNPADAEPLEVNKILSHHVYAGARAGSLQNVYVRVQYTNGSSSGRGYIPAEPLAGGACMAAYLLTKNGQKNIKYAT